MVAISPQLRASAVYNGLTISAGLSPTGSGDTTIEGYLIRATGVGIDLTDWTSGNVTIRNCLVYFNSNSTDGKGVKKTSGSLTSVTIEDCQFINQAAPLIGPATTTTQVGIQLSGVGTVNIARVTTENCSTGILLQNCTGGSVTYLENHNSRGPYPRGMALQFNGSSNFTIDMCSDESIPGICKPEDSFSNYNSDNMAWSRIVIPFMSDGVTGRGFVVEQAGSTNTTVDNFELTQVYNGAFGSFLNASGSVFTNMKASGYNLFSVNGWPGSSLSGTILCAQIVTENNPVSVAAIYEDLPTVTPNGTAVTGGNSNLWYNPGAVGTGTQTLQAWAPTLSVVRNAFPWRPTWAKPAVRVRPRIGSYWLPNPNSGANGLVANALVDGAVVSVLPGLYTYYPTTWARVWYLDGAPVSTDWNYVIPGGSSGKTLQLGETVANSAGALAEQLSAPVVIA